MSIQLDPKYDEGPKDRHNSFDIERLRYSGLRACIEYRSLYRWPRHVKVRLIKGSALPLCKFKKTSPHMFLPQCYRCWLSCVILGSWTKFNIIITSDLLYLSRWIFFLAYELILPITRYHHTTFNKIAQSSWTLWLFGSLVPQFSYALNGLPSDHFQCSSQHH